MVDLDDVHGEIAGGCRTVFCVMADQRFDRQLDWGAGSNELVQYEGSVRPGLHKHAFFQLSIGERKGPHRDISLQMKALNVVETLRCDCAARPAIGRELKTLSSVAYGLIQF